MNIMSDVEVQRNLARMGYYRGALDGILGNKSHQAILDALLTYRNDLTSSPYNWSKSRRLIAYKQLVCYQLDIGVGGIDGLMGPQTEAALFAWEAGKNGLSYDRVDKAPQTSSRTIKEVFPTQAQVRTGSSKYYGKVGENQTMLHTPYPMKLAWDTNRNVSRFSCHEKVKDSLFNILTRTLSHYGPKRLIELRLDMFGGCLNIRPIRRGKVMSIHSWGCAVDIDPVNNKLSWGKDRAKLAERDYDPFWDIVYDEGWIGLGPEKDYDWMHIQAARL